MIGHGGFYGYKAVKEGTPAPESGGKVMEGGVNQRGEKRKENRIGKEYFCIAGYIGARLPPTPTSNPEV